MLFFNVFGEVDNDDENSVVNTEKFFNMILENFNWSKGAAVIGQFKYLQLTDKTYSQRMATKN